MNYEPLMQYPYNPVYDIPMDGVFVVHKFATQAEAHTAGLGDPEYSVMRPAQNWADDHPPADGIYHAWYHEATCNFYIKDVPWYSQWISSANVPPAGVPHTLVDIPCRLPLEDEVFVQSDNMLAPGPRAWFRSKTRFEQAHPELAKAPVNVPASVVADAKTLADDLAKLEHDLGIK